MEKENLILEGLDFPVETTITTDKVNRVEVINHALEEDDEDFGRAYVFWGSNKKVKVEVKLQDEGRTLKVFISPK